MAEGPVVIMPFSIQIPAHSLLMVLPVCWQYYRLAFC